MQGEDCLICPAVWFACLPITGGIGNGTLQKRWRFNVGAFSAPYRGAIYVYAGSGDCGPQKARPFTLG